MVDYDEPVWLVGEMNPEVRSAMAARPLVTLIDGVSGLRRAGMLARLAASHLAAGQEDDLDRLQPIYLREP